MKEFVEPVVLRLATLELVGSQWRKYEKRLYIQIYPRDDQNNTFYISAVNIKKIAVDAYSYVLPPSIKRTRL